MCLLHVIAAIHLTQDGAFLGLSDSLPYVRKAYRRKKAYQVIEPGMFSMNSLLSTRFMWLSVKATTMYWNKCTNKKAKSVKALYRLFA